MNGDYFENGAAGLANGGITDNAAGLSEPDDLDRILAEWDNQKVEEPQDDLQYPDYQSDANPPPLPSAQIEQRLNEIQSNMAAQQASKDIAAVVEAVRGDADPGVVGDSLIRAWLDNEARADDRLVNLWLTRHQNPREFGQAVDKLTRKFQQEFVGQLPDREATADRAAVTAAVRGASGKMPEGRRPDLSRMSDNEYRKYVRDNFGYDVGV